MVQQAQISAANRAYSVLRIDSDWMLPSNIGKMWAARHALGRRRTYVDSQTFRCRWIGAHAGLAAACVCRTVLRPNSGPAQSWSSRDTAWSALDAYGKPC